MAKHSPAAAILLLLAVAGPAFGQNTYNATNVAAGLSANYIYVAPAINNHGDVAFYGTGGNGGTETVFRVRDGVRTVVADLVNGPLNYSFINSRIGMNGSGDVAFSGKYGESGNQSLYAVVRYAGNPGVYTSIANTGGGFDPGVYGPSNIDDAGKVVFVAGTSPGFGIFSGTGGNPTQLATTVGSQYSYFYATTVNAAGSVAFLADNNAGTGGYVGKIENGVITNVVSTGSQFTSIERDTVRLDNSGRVFFVARTADNRRGVYSSAGGAVTTLFDTDVSTGLGRFAISPNGDAVLIAVGNGLTLRTAAGETVPVYSGMPLDGSTVSGFGIGDWALNDAGQITFAAMLADGRRGVYVFTPTPEPAAVGAVVAGGLAAIAAARRRRLRCDVNENPI